MQQDAAGSRCLKDRHKRRHQHRPDAQLGQKYQRASDSKVAAQRIWMDSQLAVGAHPQVEAFLLEVGAQDRARALVHNRINREIEDISLGAEPRMRVPTTVKRLETEDISLGAEPRMRVIAKRPDQLPRTTRHMGIHHGLDTSICMQVTVRIRAGPAAGNGSKIRWHRVRSTYMTVPGRKHGRN